MKNWVQSVKNLPLFDLGLFQWDNLIRKGDKTMNVSSGECVIKGIW